MCTLTKQDFFYRYNKKTLHFIYNKKIHEKIHCNENYAILMQYKKKSLIVSAKKVRQKPRRKDTV